MRKEEGSRKREKISDRSCHDERNRELTRGEERNKVQTGELAVEDDVPCADFLGLGEQDSIDASDDTSLREARCKSASSSS